MIKQVYICDECGAECDNTITVRISRKYKINGQEKLIEAEFNLCDNCLEAFPKIKSQYLDVVLQTSWK